MAYSSMSKGSGGGSGSGIDFTKSRYNSAADMAANATFSVSADASIKFVLIATAMQTVADFIYTYFLDINNDKVYRIRKSNGENFSIDVLSDAYSNTPYVQSHTDTSVTIKNPSGTRSMAAIVFW